MAFIRTITAGKFKQKCLALMDDVAMQKNYHY